MENDVGNGGLVLLASANSLLMCFLGRVQGKESIQPKSETMSFSESLSVISEKKFTKSWRVIAKTGANRNINPILSSVIHSSADLDASLKPFQQATLQRRESIRRPGN